MDEKIDFVYGHEKRFGDFISRLDEGKVLIISDTDCDGICAAKIANKVIDADEIKFVGHGKVDNDELMREIKEGGFSKVIILDHLVKNRDFISNLERFAEVLIVDHHEPGWNFNSDKTIHFNAQGYCAAFICYYLFSKLQDLKKLDWVACCASIADWQYDKPKNWLKEVYERYGDNFELDKNGLVRTEGLIWDLLYSISLSLANSDHDAQDTFGELGDNFGEIGRIREYAEPVKNEVNTFVERFEEEKQEIKDGYFWEFKPKHDIKSIIITAISSKVLDKTLVFGVETKKGYNVSLRRQYGVVNVAELIERLVCDFEGVSFGGHPAAAGAWISLKDKEKFLKRLFEL